MNPERGGASRAPAAVPAWMRGLWRRRSITCSDGRRDDTTIVYWLQTESAFADIRIPADRPDLRDRGGLDALSEDELAQLARQAGFAGWTELDGERCHWHRVIDFQPPTGVADEGRLRLQDGVLVEEGIHEPYVEIWEPVDCGRAPPDSPRPARLEGARRALLVTCGDAFIHVRDRAVALPRAASLETLVRAAGGRRDAIVPLLDCEISFGSCRGGHLPWEIQLSTLPFHEGRSLVGPDGGLAC